MDFKYVRLTDGQYGAWMGSGMKKNASWYTGTTWGIGTANDDTINTDYYVIWNNWPTMSGALGSHINDVSGSALAGIGIDNLWVHCGANHASGTLDCAIVRKSNRSAVRVIVTGSNKDHYKDGIDTSGVITAINPTEGPWSPEMGRLRTLGYI